uniref:Uncharacterized protein n=1 Tax=Anguilla anguilla TaxID=7936 RepID=A0A0E9QTB7_ANGAN
MMENNETSELCIVVTGN